MSDQEGFLSRWSRLKREAEQSAPEPAAVAEESRAPASSAPGDTDSAGATEPTEGAPAVDLASLPPIESIKAGTDVRAFLAPGIPAQLTRAALRRAWVADPAIRDFVGLAENAWDFNAPDAVPGFGPVAPWPDVRQVIADATTGEAPQSETLPSNHGEPLEKPDVSAPKEKPGTRSADDAVQVSDRERQPAGETARDSAAVQEKEAEDRPTRMTQRHGGALPR